MQDIPRNELLHKLAAGWKCRRKHWPINSIIVKSGGTSIVTWETLLEDNWEGEPPEPVRMESKCSIIHAFWQLRNGAAFIRRGSGEDEVELNSCHTNVALTTDDILATDWEVWG